QLRMHPLPITIANGIASTFVKTAPAVMIDASSSAPRSSGANVSAATAIASNSSSGGSPAPATSATANPNERTPANRNVKRFDRVIPRNASAAASSVSGVSASAPNQENDFPANVAPHAYTSGSS